MPLPNLIHPLPTEIQSLDRSATIQDDGYGEPVQTVVYGSSFSVPAQWKWMSARELNMQNIGAVEYSTGYVLLRLVDLRALGKAIKIGDRICAYGSGAGRIELDVYVTRITYEGHYPDQQGPSLVKAYFADRQPARQNPGA